MSDHRAAAAQTAVSFLGAIVAFLPKVEIVIQVLGAIAALVSGTAAAIYWIRMARKAR